MNDHGLARAANAAVQSLAHDAAMGDQQAAMRADDNRAGQHVGFGDAHARLDGPMDLQPFQAQVGVGGQQRFRPRAGWRLGQDQRM